MGQNSSADWVFLRWKGPRSIAKLDESQGFFVNNLISLIINLIVSVGPWRSWARFLAPAAPTCMVITPVETALGYPLHLFLDGYMAMERCSNFTDVVTEGRGSVRAE